MLHLMTFFHLMVISCYVFILRVMNFPSVSQNVFLYIFKVRKISVEKSEAKQIYAAMKGKPFFSF